MRNPFRYLRNPAAASGTPERAIEDERAIEFPASYGGYVSRAEVSFDRLLEMYRIYRSYVMDEEKLIFNRAIRGVGLQVICGTIFGTIFISHKEFGDAFSRYFAAYESLKELVFLSSLLLIVLVGFISSIATARSIGAAYRAMDLLVVQWSSYVSHYLRDKVADEHRAGLTKVEFLPGLIGAGSLRIHWHGSVISRLVPAIIACIWLLMSAVLGVAIYAIMPSLM